MKIIIKFSEKSLIQQLSLHFLESSDSRLYLRFMHQRITNRCNENHCMGLILNFLSVNTKTVGPILYETLFRLHRNT